MSCRTAALLASFVAVAACRQPSPAGPELVSQWVRATQHFTRAESLAAPVAARITAYAALALYEGQVSDPRANLRSLAGQVNGLWSLPIAPRGAAIDGAVVAAETERLVLDSLFSGATSDTRRAIDSLARAQIAGRRSAGVSASIAERSTQHAQLLARAILAWAAKDGFVDTRGRAWRAPKSAVQWAAANPNEGPRRREPSIELAGANVTRRVATLPRFDPTLPTEPHWGSLRAFAIRNGDECAVPPLTYSEQRGSDLWKMSRELSDSVAALTADKRAVATLWADDGSAAGTSWRRWAQVVDQMIARPQLSGDQAAEMYALTAIATADAYIGAWKQKYRAMGVRPSANLRRIGDPASPAVGAMPPSPEYPSDASAISGAVAEVLSRTMGDSIPFAVASDTSAGGPARGYRSFTHASEEASLAGVYAGVQFVPSAVHGVTLGRCVGQRVRGRLKTRFEPR
jgi:hypothetical protein